MDLPGTSKQLRMATNSNNNDSASNDSMATGSSTLQILSDTIASLQSVIGKIQPVGPFVQRGVGEKIKDAFQSLDSSSTPIVVIVGNAGIGKSENVRHFAHTEGKDIFSHVLWFNAENFYSCVSLACAALSAMCNPISLEDTPSSQSLHPRTLFVFDNASLRKRNPNNGRSQSEFWDIQKFITDFIRPSLNISVIITSRHKTWNLANMRLIEIQPLSMLESREFLINHRIGQLNDFHQFWEEIPKKCTTIPLPLELAANVIHNYWRIWESAGDDPYLLTDFFEHYHRKGARVRTAGPPLPEMNLMSTVYVVYQLAFHNFEVTHETLASRMLNYLAYLSPNGVPRRLLLPLCASSSADLVPGFSEAIASLVQRAIVRSTAGMFFIHRLTQEARRKHVEKGNRQDHIVQLCSRFAAFLEERHQTGSVTPIELENALWACTVLEAKLHLPSVKDLFRMASVAFTDVHLPAAVVLHTKLLNCCKNEQSVSSNELQHLLLRAAQLTQDYNPKRCLEYLRPLLQDVKAGNTELTLKQSLDLYRMKAVAQKRLGHYKESFRTYTKLLTMSKALNTAERLEIECCIGRLKTCMGQYNEAWDKLTTVHEKANRHGEINYDNPASLSSHLGMAEVHLKLGRQEQALKIFADIYHYHCSKYGPNHVQSLKSEARMVAAGGNYVEASQTFNSLHCIMLKLCVKLGTNHPFIASVRFKMAAVLIEQSDYHNAMKEYERIIISLESLLGKSHPFILICKCKRAYILALEGKLKMARKSLKLVIPQLATGSGDAHPNTLNASIQLAHVYYCLEKLEKTKSQCNAILELELGENAYYDSLKIDALLCKGQCEALEGNRAEALNCYQTAYRKCEQYVDKCHPQIVETVANIAAALRELGEVDISSRILEASLRKLSSMQRTHPFLMSKLQLQDGITLVAQDQFDAGITRLTNVHDFLESTLRGKQATVFKIVQAGKLYPGILLSSVWLSIARIRRKSKSDEFKNLLMYHRQCVTTRGPVDDLTRLVEKSIVECYQLNAERAKKFSALRKFSKKEVVFLAMDCWKGVLSSNISQHGENDVQTLVAKYHYGTALNTCSKLIESENQFIQLRHALQVLNGGFIEDLRLISTREYAKVLTNLGKFEQARDAITEVLRGLEASVKYGKKHSQILCTLEIYVICLLKKGDFSGALDEVKKLRDLYRDINRDANLPDSLSYLLADAYLGVQDYEAAIEVNEALGSRLLHAHKLKWNHPEHLLCQHQYAVIKLRTGKPTYAQGKLERVIDAQVKRLGESHIETLESKVCLIEVYLRTSKVQQALKTLKSVKKAHEELLLPAYHPQVCEIGRLHGVAMALQNDFQGGLDKIQGCISQKTVSEIPSYVIQKCKRTIAIIQQERERQLSRSNSMGLTQMLFSIANDTVPRKMMPEIVASQWVHAEPLWL